MKYIFSEFLDNFLNWDSKFFTTLRYLVLKPGFLSKEYIEGKRVSYVAPIRLYILLSVLFFFTITIVGSFNKDEQDEIQAGFTYNDKTITVEYDEYIDLVNTNGIDSYVQDTLGFTSLFDRYMAKKIIVAQNSGESFGDTVIDQLSLFLLLFIPLISLIYKWTFTKNKYSYISHVVFNIHFNSFVMLMLIINALVSLIEPNFMTVFRLLFLACMLLFIFVYLFLSIKRFYQRRWWVVAYKMVFLFVGYYGLAIIFTTVLIFVSLVLTD